MQLGVRDVAKLLGVSEKTIYRWISVGRIPAQRVHDHYGFNRAELLEWANSEKIPIRPALFGEGQMPMPTLAEAIAAGGINQGVPGADKAEVLAAVVGLMPLPADVDRGFLLDVILARERLGSTGIGDGIALPHVRNPIVLNIRAPMIAVSFLARPVDFDAVDGKPVHTLFTLASPGIRQHLHLLSRLTFALMDGTLRECISRRAPAADIIAAAAASDAQCEQTSALPGVSGPPGPPVK